MAKHFFDTEYVNMIDRYMVTHPEISISQLLSDTDLTKFKTK